MNTDAQQLWILASLLAMPEDDALDALRDMLPSAPWLAPAVQELETMPLGHWQAEHTQLFITGFPKTPCPPFESAYRQGHMGGTAAGDLAAFYRRAGLRATEAPADYLGTLLECAAFLQEKGDRPELLRELRDEHLVRWVPRLARDLQTHSGLELYRILGARLEQLFPEPDHD